MNITQRQNGPVTIVSILGSVDALTAPQLTEFFSSQVQAGHVQIVADLSGLDYISSAGLRVLLGAVKEARQRNGDLRLAAIQAPVTKVLEMSGFTSILKHYPDVGAAVASFGT